jgi:flagellar basal-body rod protein FlgC
VSGLQAGGATTEQTPTAARELHDPSNPMADAHGNVRYPAVDLVQEMTTLMSASRGYEANVRSFNLLRGMMLHALEIGAK